MSFNTPLAYCIHGGNKYEGHTMLPVVQQFVKEYGLNDFIVVADSGLMTGDNITEMERLGYRYIIGARIKAESGKIKSWILAQPKTDRAMVEYDKGEGRRLLVGYTDDRAKNDAYNRDKGIRRLEKAYRSGRLTKENFNRRGYNKFLELKGDAACHNLWNVEHAFRIAKSKIEVRPMFHFTRRRIEAHVCIFFIALKVYKELERLLKLSSINMSVDKVLAMARTVTTVEIKLPLNRRVIRETMIMERHKRIAPLFEDNFWVTH